MVVLRHEVEHLRLALTSRAVIEQAKGMLMLRYGLSAESAFDLLVRWSSHRNVKLRALAALIVEAGVRDGVVPLGFDPAGPGGRPLPPQSARPVASGDRGRGG